MWHLWSHICLGADDPPLPTRAHRLRDKASAVWPLWGCSGGRASPPSTAGLQSGSSGLSQLGLLDSWRASSQPLPASWVAFPGLASGLLKGGLRPRVFPRFRSGGGLLLVVSEKSNSSRMGPLLRELVVWPLASSLRAPGYVSPAASLGLVRAMFLPAASVGPVGASPGRSTRGFSPGWAPEGEVGPAGGAGTPSEFPPVALSGSSAMSRDATLGGCSGATGLRGMLSSEGLGWTCSSWAHSGLPGAGSREASGLSTLSGIWEELEGPRLTRGAEGGPPGGWSSEAGLTSSEGGLGSAGTGFWRIPWVVLVSLSLVNCWLFRKQT